MHIEARQQAGSVVVAPAGRLDVRTYPQLRDSLLKHATDVPNALVVDLDALDVDAPPGRWGARAEPAAVDTEVRESAVLSPLSVFTTVWRELQEWPGIPLHLASTRDDLIRRLAASTVSWFVPTHGSVAAALDAVGDPPLRRRIELIIPFAAGDAAHARRWMRQVLADWGFRSSAEPVDDATEAFVDDAVLVASELVENLLRHARTDGALQIELRTTGLAIAVSDRHPRPVPTAPVSAHRGGGRGLAVVNKLTTAWGYRHRLGGGKVVWAHVAMPPRR